MRQLTASIDQPFEIRLFETCVYFCPVFEWQKQDGYQTFPKLDHLRSNLLMTIQSRTHLVFRSPLYVTCLKKIFLCSSPSSSSKHLGSGSSSSQSKSGSGRHDKDRERDREREQEVKRLLGGGQLTTKFQIPKLSSKSVIHYFLIFKLQKYNYGFLSSQHLANTLRRDAILHAVWTHKRRLDIRSKGECHYPSSKPQVGWKVIKVICPQSCV